MMQGFQRTVAILLLAPLGALAQTGPRDCVGIENDIARLQCFDRAVEAGEQAPGTPAQPDGPRTQEQARGQEAGTEGNTSSSPEVADETVSGEGDRGEAGGVADAGTAAGDGRASGAEEPAPDAGTSETGTAPARTPSQDSGAATFGLEGNRDESPLDEMTFVAADARYSEFTGWTIEFENGQVWRQVGTDRYDIEPGERYTIQRAVFGSFLLGGPGSNAKIRVRREK